MTSALPALLLLGLQTACSPRAVDSARASEAGWALQTEGPTQRFLLTPGDSYSWELEAFSKGLPCEGCSVEQDASVELSVKLEPVSESGEVLLQLGAASRTIELDGAREVLLRAPLFEACAAPPVCAEPVPVSLRSEVALKGSWSARAQATSTHDERGWEPGAELSLKLR